MKIIVIVAAVVVCFVLAPAQLQVGSLCEQTEKTDISFVNGDTQYSVFDDYNGEQKPVQHEQGVKITTPKREWVLNCRGRAKAHYEDLAEVFPEPE